MRGTRREDSSETHAGDSQVTHWIFKALTSKPLRKQRPKRAPASIRMQSQSVTLLHTECEKIVLKFSKDMLVGTWQRKSEKKLKS